MYQRMTIVVFSVLVLAVAGWTQQDPLIGTWKLNPAKSKGAASLPKSEILKFEPYNGDGLKTTMDGMNAQGKATHSEMSAKFDGKDYPIAGNPNADTISMKRIDANTTELTFKNASKATGTIRRVVSSDGKTLTVTNKGTNARAQAVTSGAVFDKQ
jgi:hypothetical protein